jgi:methylenetetrahydrofolate/methylenetetrahydromethanopterin dehydrogenase (NADP+)
MAPSRILIQLDHNPHARVFDRIMALDGGADHVLEYGDVEPQDVALLVSGALHSRPAGELSRTAILVTGTNDRVVEEMVRQATRSFFGRYRVSLMSECKGGNVVAGATLARLAQLLPLDGAKALVIGGGPVGARIAGLLAAAGARAVLTVFDHAEAEERRRFVTSNLGVELATVVWKSGEPVAPFLAGVRLVVAAGPPGLLLLPRSVWEAAAELELLVDVSGAEPPGIDGITGEEDGDLLPVSGREVRVLGGLAISRYKVRVHREAVARLFADDAIVLGLPEIAAIARDVV